MQRVDHRPILLARSRSFSFPPSLPEILDLWLELGLFEVYMSEKLMLLKRVCFFECLEGFQQVAILEAGLCRMPILLCKLLLWTC